MKYLGKAKNKRGHEYNVRPTRAANGYSATYASQRIVSNPAHQDYNKDKIRKCLNLSLYGNFDALNRRLIEPCRKEHPVNEGYFKSSFRLNQRGQKRLRELKEKYTEKIIKYLN
jgi:hypothetical protein